MSPPFHFTTLDWAIIAADFSAYARQLPIRIAAHLKLLEGDFGGFPVDRLTHIEALFAIKPQPSLSQAGDGYLLFRIGDCVAQRNTHAAIYDALRLCKDF